MATVKTLAKLAWTARNGVSWRDRHVAFLAMGLSVMGRHRKRTYQQFLHWLNRSDEDLIPLRIWQDKHILHLAMRRGNEADYLIGGEFIRGSYDPPPFEPDMIVDGGANIGTFTIHAHQKFPSASLHCYEPDPENFKLLNYNLKLNQISAHLYQAGIWSTSTTLYYHALASHLGYLDNKPPGLPIPCTLPELTENSWLKLDIEGAEYNVLPVLLERGPLPKWITLEIHFFDKKGKEILELLVNYGYILTGDLSPHLNSTVVSAYRE